MTENGTEIVISRPVLLFDIFLSVDSHITHGSTSPVYLSLLVVAAFVSLVADASGGDDERGKNSPVESGAAHQQRGGIDIC